MARTLGAGQPLQQQINSITSQLKASFELRRASGYAGHRFRYALQRHKGANDDVVLAVAVACKPVSSNVDSLQLHFYHLAGCEVDD